MGERIMPTCSHGKQWKRLGCGACEQHELDAELATLRAENERQRDDFLALREQHRVEREMLLSSLDQAIGREERLHAENERLQQTVDCVTAASVDEREALKKENERMREENERLRGAMERALGGLKAAEASVEKIEAALRRDEGEPAVPFGARGGGREG